MRFRSIIASGWVPAALLALATVAVLVAYGTPIDQVAIFAVYVAFGLALPGMLWVRWFRGRPAHIAEDLALGTVAGYCLELGSYVVARVAGLPQLFLLGPATTYALFIGVPALRRHWRGDPVRAPAWWSWTLAATLGFVLWYSAVTFFAQHSIVGTYVPYVDMPWHLALIGELKHHIPPQFPYVTGVPLAYHWFFYADAAATSWATGIEPATLLYRLSGLPMFVVFVVLTATAARRLTGGWWSGPAAVAMALFGSVATPYAAIPTSVFDSQTLPATWISPTNLFGLAVFAAALLVVLDVIHADGKVPRKQWFLVGLLLLEAAGAKATLMPPLIAGLVAAVIGIAILQRRLQRAALVVLGVAVAALAVAIVFVYPGTSGSFVLGLESLRLMPIAQAVGSVQAHGAASLVLPAATLLIALVLWSFLWAAAYGLLAHPRRLGADPRLLLLFGICGAALGAATLLRYPGISELYYLRGASGAFGLLTVAGIAALLPASARRAPLARAIAAAALLGAAAVTLVQALGPARLPRTGADSLPLVVLAMVLPVVALAAVAIVAALLARLLARRTTLAGAAPLLFVALVMGFGLPASARLVSVPLTSGPPVGPTISSDAITAARWLRDHSDPDELVATNLHCLLPPSQAATCDPRHFWVSAYSERRVLVEGWSYTPPATAAAARLGARDLVTAPFWDPALLALNDSAFVTPSVATLAELRQQYGVRWLFADLSLANGDAIAEFAPLRYRIGNYAVYQLK